MSSATAAQLEQRISLLSCDEQLWLVERVIHRLRTPQPITSIEQQLQAMAHDPEVQQELQVINAEFINAEMDNLSGGGQ